MKKLLAIVLAVVMCTAALLTCVSAEDYAAGTEFNISKKDKSGAFSYGFIDDKALDLSKYAEFTDSAADAAGLTGDGLSTGLAQIYYNGTKPANFGWGQPEGAKALFVGQIGVAQCYASYVNHKIIKFTAPVDGVYTMNATTLSFHAGCFATSVNGAEFVKSDIHHGAPATGADSIDHTLTFSLKAGEALYISLFREGDSTDDKDCITMQLKGLTVKLDKLGYDASVNEAPKADEPENPGTDTPDEPAGPVATYDLIANFADLKDQGFSFATRDKEGVVTPFAEWSDGTGNIVSATHESAMVGYYDNTFAKGEKAVANHAVFHNANDNDIKFYPNANAETLIVFTAPESGTYTFEFKTQGVWGYQNSSTRIYVEVGGEVKAEAKFEKGTAKDQAIAEYKGTVELKAGETIYLAYDPEDSAAGDNSYLQVAKVTLDKIAENTDEPVAPSTNDALVAVIALAAVAGTALVISKKH